jgi:hypothetical protein
LTPVFFTDRDLGNQFGDILRAASLIVERHGDHFPPNCPDEIWLHEVGLRGWIAITHNRRIRHTPNELASVIEHNVALLVVIGAARRHREQADCRSPRRQQQLNSMISETVSQSCPSA